VNSGKTFAIGRVQSVAAAGGAQAHPSLRGGGLPGRRSHTSKTRWALGLIPTVRIGAGAWRTLANTRPGGGTDQGKHAKFTAGKRDRKPKEKKKLLKKERWAALPGTPAHPSLNNLPLSRATPLHSVALGAASVIEERKNLTEKLRPS